MPPWVNCLRSTDKSGRELPLSSSILPPIPSDSTIEEAPHSLPTTFLPLRFPPHFDRFAAGGAMNFDRGMNNVHSPSRKLNRAAAAAVFRSVVPVPPCNELLLYDLPSSPFLSQSASRKIFLLAACQRTPCLIARGRSHFSDKLQTFTYRSPPQPIAAKPTRESQSIDEYAYPAAEERSFIMDYLSLSLRE